MQADRIYCGDALTVLKTLPDNSVNCCITSPPYYALRDYGVDGQIGREETPALYVERLTSIFREVRRVLTPDGTLWLNIADTYAGKGNQGESLDPKYPNGRTGQVVALNGKVEGCKAKDMIGIPWLLAFALRADGWYLRSDIIWMKANPMPESTKDRPSRCYEHIFLLSIREVMQFIKYSKDTEKLSQLVEENTAFETMDRKAVRVMEEMTGMKIEKEVEEEKVNVCKAIQGIEERGRAAGRSEGIQIGAEHEQRLTKSLLKDNRIDDLKRALDDPAFRQKLLEEYGID